MKAKSRQKSAPVIVSPVGQILSTEDVAKLLGVSQRTIQEMVRTGKLNAVKVGKSYRILDQHLRQLFGVEESTSRTSGLLQHEIETLVEGKENLHATDRPLESRGHVSGGR